MDTHADSEFKTPEDIQRLMEKLQDKATRLSAAGENRITSGTPGEPEVAQSVGQVLCIQRPDDPDGILRVSLGEGPEPITFGTASVYCVFRGDPRDVIELLERAFHAMQASHFEQMGCQLPKA